MYNILVLQTKRFIETPISGICGHCKKAFRCKCLYQLIVFLIRVYANAYLGVSGRFMASKRIRNNMIMVYLQFIIVCCNNLVRNCTIFGLYIIDTTHLAHVYDFQSFSHKWSAIVAKNSYHESVDILAY